MNILIESACCQNRHSTFASHAIGTNKRNSSRLIRFLLCSIIPLFLAGRIEAGLVPGGGDLDNDLNNALRFDPSTPTPVKVAYKDASLPADRFIQVGFSTTNTASFLITGIAWSKDNISYTEFTPANFVDGIVSGGNIRYSPIIDLGQPISGSSTTPFFLRYTLPSGLDVGTLVQSSFRANSNGSELNGVLSDQITNSFVSLTRLHTAVPEPTSLLLTASVATLGLWRGLARRKKYIKP